MIINFASNAFIVESETASGLLGQRARVGDAIEEQPRLAPVLHENALKPRVIEFAVTGMRQHHIRGQVASLQVDVHRLLFRRRRRIGCWLLVVSLR